ncbi:hypothetical protein Rpal_4580 [Rhodopseudomonas palustris TIE-1]|nr:hypothetical protein [Rhodopseudomonas palustris]ACF03074.1 hypothetical protein Rpal_4580 [Rhodopseudomonas palustris TIE-1]
MSPELADMVMQTVEVNFCPVIASDTVEHAAGKCPLVVAIFLSGNGTAENLRLQIRREGLSEAHRASPAIEQSPLPALTSDVEADQLKDGKATLERLEEDRPSARLQNAHRAADKSTGLD